LALPMPWAHAGTVQRDKAKKLAEKKRRRRVFMKLS
jgi:hypothetical protein